MKRKRTRARDGNNLTKRAKLGPDRRHEVLVDYPLLRLYYHRVSTLREHLLSQSEKLSKYRKRLIASYGHRDDSEDNPELCSLLDETIIGSITTENGTSNSDDACREQEFTAFSQELTESTGRSSSSGLALSQIEIIDFVIWSIFRRHPSTHKPPHMLCHGFLRSGAANQNALEMPNPTTIPGILSQSVNEYVHKFKKAPWTLLPTLLGKDGEILLIDMFITCGMFHVLKEGERNLLQISGPPLSDSRQIHEVPKTVVDPHPDIQGVRQRNSIVKASQTRGLNSIRFVRHRILYGRPVRSAKNQVCIGLHHAHVLNRSREGDDSEVISNLLKYVFPRQFGLHNVFTSDVDPKSTAQAFADYTTREKEIKHACFKDPRFGSKVPKRLRGQCERLVDGLRRRHARCPYVALLQHYCPVTDKMANSMPSAQGGNVMSLATPAAQVSAYCRSVVGRLFPHRVWGDVDTHHNRSIIMHQIDRFIKLRRYESMTMHDVLQNIKIIDISWMKPPCQTEGAKMSISDSLKRKEIFAELVYFLFDSIVIPLINSNFHATESSSQRNQILYFRHDVWQKLSKPALTTIKLSMFEPLESNKIERVLSRRGMGTSRIRLLPKDSGLRPIINLRRRVLTRINGQAVLTRSINSILTPAFTVLNYEKLKCPQRLGSSLFSADDIFPRLQQFRTCLQKTGYAGRPLYFAKLDVLSCFDTIPQGPLMALLRKVFTADEYIISRHAEAKVLGSCTLDDPIMAKATWKYASTARASNEARPFSSAIAGVSRSRRGTVFVDSVVQNSETDDKLLSLLGEHIKRNVVQIGGRYYRQKTGIPQGSIVSSLLCSFFYAELEERLLGFLNDGESLLLRLIDDFLLISTSRTVASRFVQLMHAGIPEYGIKIKREKSVVNFDVEIDGVTVPKLPLVTDFPYCGNAINTVDLCITKDEVRRQKNNMASAVTVEYSKTPGQKFYRKMLDMLKLHLHTMHLCTAHNGLETVMSNLYRAFSDTAERCVHYMRSLSGAKRPGLSLMMRTISDLIDLGFSLMQRKKEKAAGGSFKYECIVTKVHTRWLASRAFSRSFRRRQTGFGELLAWLNRQGAEAGLALCGSDRLLLERVAWGAEQIKVDYRI